MNETSLRGAAERLLNADEGIGEGMDSDYVAAGYAADDAIILAQHTLAELDPTLVDETKLREIGFEEYGHSHFECGDFPCFVLGPLLWYCSGVTSGGGDPPDPFYSLRYRGKTLFTNDDLTCGKLRTLVRLLGYKATMETK